MKKILLSWAVLFSALSLQAQEARISPSMRKAMDAIDTNTIRGHIAYLSDDKLLGRMPGQPGYDMAADYVIDHFKKLGLQPAGDAGSFKQKLTLRRSTLQKNSLHLWLSDANGNIDSLSSRTDLAVSPHPLKPSVDLRDAPLVFAGYGVDIPGKHSDYTNLDVKGKVVVVLRTAPEGLTSTYNSHFGNVGYKMELAKSKGAIGLIVVSPAPSPFFAGPPTVTNSVSPDKSAAYGSRYIGNLDLYINGSYSLLQSIFLQSGKNLKQVIADLKAGKTQSFDLGKKISASFKTSYNDIETYNVIGMIPGTDAKLKSEYVVHTAHLDHIGVARAANPVNEDSIFNGAHDNASGVASLMEIARLYKTSGAKPKRSILITMVSAEESGLLGSAYFASNPSVPKSAVVANVNTDMPVIIAPCNSVIPLGAQHSTMMKHVQFATSALNLQIEEDPEPQENFFVRSDQYSFVREHIPAVHIKTGRKSNIPGFDLNAYVKAWRAKYYHKPEDQLEGGLFHFGAAKTYIQVNFLTSYSVAMDPNRPKWNDGELF